MLVKYELDDDFEMNWCYNLMFVIDLNVLLCLQSSV